MSRRQFKFWLIGTLTITVVAVIIILSYWIRRATSWDGLIMLALLVGVVVIIYALAIRFILRPERRLLSSTSFKVVTTAILSAGLVSGVIHYFRFIPSPEAATTYSKTVATLLIVAGLSAYALLMALLWKGLKKDI